MTHEQLRFDWGESAEVGTTFETVHRDRRTKAIVPPKVLVVLSELDRKYRENVILKEQDFCDSFLAETRCQRIGCTHREFFAMTNYERARHLADEAVILRLPDWDRTPAAYLDWQTINLRAVQSAKQLEQDFAECRTSRRAENLSVLYKRGRA